jgi:hypothetical protein
MRSVPAAANALAFEGKGFSATKATRGQSDRAAAKGQARSEVLEAKIPERASQRFVVGGQATRSALSVAVVGAEPAPLEVEEGRGVYRAVQRNVDLIAVRDPRYFELAFVVRDLTTDPSLSLEVEGNVPGTTLTLEPGSGAALVRRSGGAPLARIDAPVAMDSVGVRRDGRYEVAGSKLRLLFDWSGLKAPVFVDPRFVFPYWSILSDERAPGALSYDLTSTSREIRLAFDEVRGKTVLIRPVRSQQREDSATSFAELARAQVDWYGGFQQPGISSILRASPDPRYQPKPLERADWARTYQVESETWQWSGTRWDLLPVTGLPGLIDPALVFDRARQRLVATSGAPPGPPCRHRVAGSSTLLEDVTCTPATSVPVHELASGDWTGRPIAASPPLRIRAASASAPPNVLLFGGRSLGAQKDGTSVDPYGPPYPDNLASELLNDTWRFDGVRWQQVPASNPPTPRQGATLVFDERRQISVLVGGVKADNQDSFDLWEFDGVDWVERIAAGDATLPVSLRGRTGMLAVWNPLRQTTLLFGGKATRLDSCMLSESEIQSRRVTDFEGVNQAGCLGGYMHDSWEWDGRSLRQLTRVAYGGRVRGMAVFRQVQESGAPWAGSPPANASAQTSGQSPLLPWRYDSDRDHFRLRSTLERAHAPSTTSGPRVTAAGEVVTISGTAPAAPTFVSPLFASAARSDMVFDRARGVAIIVAPEDGRVFETTGANWVERTPNATPFASGQQDFFGATWDPAAQRVLLFDPRSASTWAKADGAGWSRLSPTASPPTWSVDPEVRRLRDVQAYRLRQEDSMSYIVSRLQPFLDVAKRVPQMTFDRARGRTVMFYNRALWEFDGTTWTERPAPPGWSDCPAATLVTYDGARSRLVAVGCKVPAQTMEWDGSSWHGPFAGPYETLVDRNPFPNLPPLQYFMQFYWRGTLQLGWSHPNAIFESALLGGVSAFDANGTLRTWNGSSWITGKRLQEGYYCDWSDPAGNANRFLFQSSGSAPGNRRHFLANGIDFAPLCLFPPGIEDRAHHRILAFRDGVSGLRELSLDVPEPERAWHSSALGEFLSDGYRIHPHPFEVLSPEHLVLSTLSDPTSRAMQFPAPVTPPFDPTKDLDRVPESLVNNLFWPFRLLPDSNSQRIRILTHRGAVWELGAEVGKELGDECTTSADCIGSACVDGVCCNAACSGPCVTCAGSSRGTCQPLAQGQPDPKGRCGSGECAPVCSGRSTVVNGSTASSCEYPTATRECGETPTCSDGRQTSRGHCKSGANVCLPPTGSQPCPGGLGCADATSCRTACSKRSDCTSGLSTCSSDGTACVPDAAITLANGRGIVPLEWHPSRVRTAQELADLLRQAGFEQDANGRILFGDQAFGGVTPFFDPNLKTPMTGLRSCVYRLQACALANNAQVDQCVAGTPRCVGETPWVGDPGGDDCCPEACLTKYFEARATESAFRSFRKITDGSCYPGFSAFIQELNQ